MECCPANGRSSRTFTVTARREFSGIGFGQIQLYPQSRGSIHIQSTNPADDPAIDPNYLADPLDVHVTMRAMRIMREIGAQPALAPYVVEESLPGRACESDADMLAYVKASGQTSWHPISSCRMGGRRTRRGRREAKCPWNAGAAGHRLVDHAGLYFVQHQHSNDHDRRKGCRHGACRRCGRALKRQPTAARYSSRGAGAAASFGFGFARRSTVGIDTMKTIAQKRKT
jgi:hypothetical protein